MPRFAANLSMLYQEHEFLDRFEAAARDGFAAVEYLFPYAWSAGELAMRLRRHGLRQVLFNAPPGDFERGERGLACIPGREAEYRSAVAMALDYAAALDCPRIHVMAGIVPQGLSREAAHGIYVENLRWAAEQAAKSGCEVLIEPINTRDIPRYLLNRQDQAHEIVRALGAPNLKVQMDLYHCQIAEGDVTTKLREYLPSGNVGHLQVAGVPERHEPDTGELNGPYLFGVIDELSVQCGWQGWVGCEYRPRGGAQRGATTAGLDYLRAARTRP